LALGIIATVLFWLMGKLHGFGNGAVG